MPNLDHATELTIWSALLGAFLALTLVQIGNWLSTRIQRYRRTYRGLTLPELPDEQADPLALLAHYESMVQVKAQHGLTLVTTGTEEQLHLHDALRLQDHIRALRIMVIERMQPPTAD